MTRPGICKHHTVLSGHLANMSMRRKGRYVGVGGLLARRRGSVWVLRVSVLQGVQQ